MTMKSGSIGLACLISTTLVGTAATAQTFARSGLTNAQISRNITVRATEPNTEVCDASGDPGCFRIIFEIAPATDQEIGVSFADGADGFVAFTGNGGSCRARATRGVESGAWDRLRETWNQTRLTYAITGTPAILAVDYVCDAPVVSPVEVTFQANFHIYVNNSQFGAARYVFRKGS